MIITFASLKGGIGKTTLAIALANYVSGVSNTKIKVYDLDAQKSFYNKWMDDQNSELPKLYDVEFIETLEERPPNMDRAQIIHYKESDDLFLFDLEGTMDRKYTDVLVHSDFIIIPFEYSDISVKSTLIFKNLLGLLESEAQRIFIRSKYEKCFNYLNQQVTDHELSKYGILTETPVFRRSCLQNIDTRKLTFAQKCAVKKPFNEILEVIKISKKHPENFKTDNRFSVLGAES